MDPWFPLIWVTVLGYFVSDVFRIKHQTHVKHTVKGSLERMAAIRSAIIATTAAIILAIGIVVFFGFRVMSDEGFVRYLDGVVALLYCYKVIVFTRQLIRLIKDDDSWFSRSWKKLKKWAKSLRFNINFGFKPKLA